MEKQQAGRWVLPNPQIPRSFGLMNTTFGTLLLLTAVGYGLMYAYAPVLQKTFSAPMKQIEAKEKADRAAKVAELKAQENAAKSAEEKQAVAAERAAVESRVVVSMSSFDELYNLNVYNEPRIAAYYIFDISTAVILNIAMIVSGVGLMALKDWARRLALWVAKLKILRWILMVAGAMTVIVPLTLERVKKATAAMEAQIKSGGAAVPFSMSDLMRWSMLAGVVFMIFSAIIACVYPAMMWWNLTRPAARAACLMRQQKPQPERPEPSPQCEPTV